MTKKSFADAVDMSRAIFYDLNSKQIRFTFRSISDQKKMIFTAKQDADIVKSIFPQFEIQFDTHKARYAELVIVYE